MWTLRKKPGEGNLSACRVVLSPNLSERICEGKNAREVLLWVPMNGWVLTSLRLRRMCLRHTLKYCVENPLPQNRPVISIWYRKDMIRKVNEQNSTHVFSSQQTTPERRIGHNSHAEFKGGLLQANVWEFYIKSERWIFDFEGWNRVDCICTAQCRCRTFR